MGKTEAESKGEKFDDLKILKNRIFLKYPKILFPPLKYFLE